jgi:hypothetical protein
MNTSPIEAWEGAEAYFTFADSPLAIGVILLLSVLVTVVVIGSAVRHENESYAKLDKKS